MAPGGGGAEIRSSTEQQADDLLDSASDVVHGRGIRLPSTLQADHGGPAFMVRVDENENIVHRGLDKQGISRTYRARRISYCLRAPNGDLFKMDEFELIAWVSRFFGRRRPSRAANNSNMILLLRDPSLRREYQHVPIVDAHGNDVGSARVGDWRIRSSDGTEIFIPRQQASPALDALRFVREGGRSECVFDDYRKPLRGGAA